MPGMRVLECDRCGKVITKRRRADRATLCPACAEAAIAESIRQIRARQGPAWDKYRAGQLAHYRKMLDPDPTG